MKNSALKLFFKTFFTRMAPLMIAASIFLLLLTPTKLRAAAFTPGNLVVYRAGAGSVTLDGTATAVFLDEYTTSGTLVQSIALPTTSSGSVNALLCAGNSTSEGLLSRSTDGRYLVLAGYKSTVGTASISGTTASTVPRTVGRVDISGNIDTSTALTDFSSGSNARSVASTDGTGFWVAGGAGNIRYATLGNTTSTSLESALANVRQLNVFSGQLYFSTGSGTTYRVGTVGTGTPTTAGQTIANLNGIPTTAATSCDGFFFADLSPTVAGLDTLYVANDTGAGITKYSFDGTTWTAVGSIDTANNYFGLTASVSGTTVTIYASRAGSALVTVTDSSGYAGTLSGTPTVIASAATKTAIRGVAFGPITPPAVTASAASSIGTTSATLNGNATSDGGATVTDRGFVYKTSAGVTISDNKTTVSGTTGSFTLTPTLGINTQYYFKAYAINSVGTTLSSPELSFWTLASTPTTPTVNNPTTSSLDVTIGSGDSNPSATTYAIHETSQNKYVQADGTLGASAVFQTATTWNTKTVTGLGANATYTFEVKAQNGGGTATSFSSSASGTTSVAASPTISVSPTSLSFSPILVGGTSTNQTYTVSGLSLTANITITAPPNFEVSTASGSGFGNSLTLTQAGGTVPNTTIYVHFKPTAQTSYSDNITNFSSGANNSLIAVSGVGATGPAVTTQAASAITTNGVTFNGTVTASNNAVILDRGFYWKTSPGVSAADTKASEGGTDVSAFTKTLTGLSANTIYYYRAYATNILGTTLDSADTSFYTLANTPVAPTVNGATTNTLSVAIGSDGNPAGTFYAIQETNSGNYVQANGTLNSTVVYKTATAWGTTVVTNLSLGTLYFFQVQATNGAGVATAFGPVKSANTANLPFTPGNLVVYRVGDGATTLSSAGAPVYLDEYNISGTRIQSFPLPTTSSGSVNALVAAGNSASEGLLTRSADGRYLMFTGYKAAVGAANVGTSSSSTTPRTVARVDNSGSTDTSTALTDLSTGSNPRTVASVDGTAFWAGGGAGGVRYAALGATTSTQIESPAVGNTRQFNIFSNQLYLTTGSGTTIRLGAVGTGTPTTTGQTVVNIPGFPTSGGSPYAFFFCTLNGGAGPDTVYVADDGAVSGSQPAGIQKYCLVSGSWTSLGTITAANVRGLTASVSGTTVTLYGSTAGTSASATGGTLYLVTDTAGYNAAPSTTTASTLATATANMAFRGVAFAPKYSQTISPITAIVTKNYGDSAYSVATTASSSLTVTYSSDNTSVATVNSSGIVTIIGAGIAHITANQAGNDSYAAAAQVLQTLTVNKITPTFNLTSSSNPSGYKSSVTFTANTILPADVTGTIQFATNGGNLGSAVTISSGSAVSPATTALPRAATNIIKAIYSGDVNYLSITNTLTQILTNHPPVTSNNTYTRIGASNWTIAISDLLTNASDADSDSLTLIALSTSTNGVTLDTNSTPGVVKYTNTNPVNDQFSYTVTDGFGGTNTAVITLTSGSTSGVGGVANSINFSSGTTSLTFTGLPGYLYNVQVSTNLTSWNTIWTTNAPSSGVFQFNDTSAPLSAAYYRLMWNGN